MKALEQIDGWPVPHGSAALVRSGVVVAQRGQVDHVYHWASVTKLLTASALLIALEEGVLELEDEAGPPGSTVRHLAAHASGLPFDAGPPIAPPGRRRIYSNAGFEALAEAIAEAAEMPFDAYLKAAVLEPLGAQGELRGSPATGFQGDLGDLVLFARELLRPRLVAAETLAEATTVQFAGLDGVLPDWGRMEPNDWGLGFELRDAKSPHWTGTLVSERTFGHFGGSGTFLWVDPASDVALCCLTDREFGEWAKEAWPRLSDAVVAEAA